MSNITRTTRSRPTAVRGDSRSYPPSQHQLHNSNQAQLDSQPERSVNQRTFEHRGGYSVLTPDMTKRNKIQRGAEAETKAYEKYKQANKHRYTTTTATVGVGAPGGPLAANRLLSTKPKTTSLTKPSLRSQSLRANDPQIEQHKASQRQKAERNQAREKEKQKHRDQDRRVKNEAFLSRLEQTKKF